MIESILVTGGCGFVGSWTVDLLVKKGYKVTILDSLEPQVHQRGAPTYLNRAATFIQGDVRDGQLLGKLVKEADAVVHLAANVGVGQSMYQIEKYVDTNTRGTAVLLDSLVNNGNDVRKLVVASSMSIYGEGKYYCESCQQEKYPKMRETQQLDNSIWDPKCPDCGSILKSVPTDEDKPLHPTSIYAMSKRDQEEMCLLIGETYNIPVVALRYFNIYGPRQSLSNPYTGVCAIFLSRILSSRRPYIFEDGQQSRDFVHVSDIARANVLAIESENANYRGVNIGSGQPISILRLATLISNIIGVDADPEVAQEYRKGDIRHCYADIEKARKLLSYSPSVSIEDGLKDLSKWALENRAYSVDLFEEALNELKSRRLA